MVIPHIDFGNVEAGLDFCKTSLFIIIAKIIPIENVDIYAIHIQPIITEIFRILAYAAASLSLFKFILAFFKTPKKEDKEEVPKVDKEND